MRDQIKQVIQEVLVELLCLEPNTLTDDARWKDLGADSLDIVEVVLKLEDKFDIDIPDEDVRRLAEKPIGEMILYMEGRLKQ